MVKFKLMLVLVGLLAMSLFGCSGGNPVTSGDENSLFKTADGTTDSVPGLIGIYEVNVDTCKETATIEPFRTSASTDVMEVVDITSFMTVSPCRDCVRIFGVKLNEGGSLTLQLGIKHPFAIGDPGKPATGRNRADLHVFNVEGIIVSDSPQVSNFPGMNLKCASGGLVNADGYTRYLDPILDVMYMTQSDLHPYILHFDDYSTGNYSASNPCGFANPLNPIGNLVMKMGSGYDIKDYEFKIESGKALDFLFTIGCSYGITTQTFEDRFTPEYRCPQHNKKAASEVHINVLSNTLERGKLTSSAELEIQVMDINQGVEVGTGLDEMMFASNVSKITVEAPSIMNATILMNNPTALSGDGRTAPLTYKASVKNEKNAPYGYYPCVVKVLDSYPTHSNTNPALMGADGIGRVGPTSNPLGGIFAIDEFATYAYVDLLVLPRTEGNPLRITVPPIDFAVDGNGQALIGYSDNQIWRYEPDYSIGSRLYTFSYSGFGALKALAAQSDGSSVCIGAGGC